MPPSPSTNNKKRLASCPLLFLSRGPFLIGKNSLRHRRGFDSRKATFRNTPCFRAGFMCGDLRTRRFFTTITKRILYTLFWNGTCCSYLHSPFYCLDDRQSTLTINWGFSRDFQWIDDVAVQDDGTECWVSIGRAPLVAACYLSALALSKE